jgi:hypothetical protein
MIPLNLKTSHGRCAPLALQQVVPEMPPPELPTDVVVVTYTRPPLDERGCCSGDDEDAVPTPVFTVVSTCRYVSLESPSGFFVLEDTSGYIALECAR